MSRLLIHGFAGAPEQWPAASAARVVLLGHRGSPSRATTFEEEVDRIAEQVRAIAPLDLAGYSLGARVALGLVVRHPALFSSATLFGVHPGLERAEDRQARAAADERWARLLEDQGIGAFAAAWEKEPIFATQAGLRREVLEAQRAVRLSHDPRELARGMRVLGLAMMPSYWSALPAIALPVHLVAGARDAKFLALAERASALIPRAKLTAVPGAGHNLLIEAPEAVREVLP